MSRTLASWQFDNWTGESPVYIRYAFDSTFEDSDGISHLQGNSKENYIQDTCTLVGTTVTVPSHPSFATTDDLPNGSFTTVSAWLCGTNGRNMTPVFSNWIIPAGVGDPITRTDLITRNEARVELRDRETYSASVIDSKIAAAVSGSGAPKMTDAVYGIATLYEPADSAVTPEVPGTNSIFVRSVRTQAKASLPAASVKTGTTTKLTDGNRGFVYDDGTTYTRLLPHFDARDWGAKDDDSFDNQTAINAAITAAYNEGGGIVRLSYRSSGVYRIGGPLTYKQGVIIEGENSVANIGSKVKLRLTANSSAAIIVGQNLTDVVIRNLELYTTTTSSMGVRFVGDGANATQIISLSNLSINGFETSVGVLATDIPKAWQCSYAELYNCTFHNCLYGLYLDAYNSDWNVTNLKVYGREDAYGVYLNNGGTVLLSHCNFMGPAGAGAVCALGVPNPSFSDTCIHLEGPRGNITVQNCQQEGFRKSLVNNYADMTYPINFFNNVMGAPIDLNQDCFFNSIGNVYFDNTVTAANNVKVSSIGDFIDTRDSCLDAGTGIGGFTFTGNAKMVLRSGKFGVDIQNRLNIGDLLTPDSTDPSLATTPIIQVGDDTTAKVLFRLGSAVSGVMTAYYNFLRDSQGFLCIEGNQDIPSRGIRTNGPLKFAGSANVAVSEASRSVSDAVVVTGQPGLTSATASFVAADRGKLIALSGGSTVPEGTYIKEVTNGTTIVLSANVTTSGSGRTLFIAGTAVLNYDPVSTLTQLSENGAAVVNVIKAATTLTTNRIVKATGNGVIANSLWTDNGTNMQLVSGLLQFLGTSSSFPALKRNSTGLEVRLADDSAQGPFSALSLSLNGGTALATTNQTGTGNLVLATAPTVVNAVLTNPTMTTPTLGVASATSLASTTVTVGSGTAITKILRGSVTIDPASIGATTVSSQAFTLTGAVAGDTVIMNPPTAGINAGVLVLQSYINAADSVTIVFYNTTGGGIDVASASWTYCLIRS